MGLDRACDSLFEKQCNLGNSTRWKHYDTKILKKSYTPPSNSITLMAFSDHEGQQLFKETHQEMR